MGAGWVRARPEGFRSPPLLLLGLRPEDQVLALVPQRRDRILLTGTTAARPARRGPGESLGLNMKIEGQRGEDPRALAAQPGPLLL